MILVRLLEMFGICVVGVCVSWDVWLLVKLETFLHDELLSGKELIIVILGSFFYYPTQDFLS